jgi:hypothetical protein
MLQGNQSHEIESIKIQRRSFRFLEASEPEKVEKNVRLISNHIGFHGIADAILIWNHFIVVLDFKTHIDRKSNWKRSGALLQLALYGLLAEEKYQRECRFLLISLMKAKSHEDRYWSCPRQTIPASRLVVVS